MNHAFLDRYARLSSPIHKLKSSSKLMAGIIGLLLLLILFPILNPQSTLYCYAGYAIGLGLVALISRVPLSFLLTRSALVLPFSALIILVNYISGHFSGPQLLETLIKSLLSVFTLLLLTSTTPFHAIHKQLSYWRAPELLIIILSFMYRYFIVLAGEIEALERGIKMRHSSISGWGRIDVYANIIAMVLIRSYERAEKVYQAMRMRGFTGDLT